MPRITALRPERSERVRVELDGAAWRTLPTGAIVAAGLSVGSELDRVRARELARALRRSRALTAASAALSRRDRSAAGLEAYLGARKIAAADRAQAVETLERLGYVDDARFAADRAAQLARRGFGDEGIRCRLEAGAPRLRADRRGACGTRAGGRAGTRSHRRWRRDAEARAAPRREGLLGRGDRGRARRGLALRPRLVSEHAAGATT